MEYKVQYSSWSTVKSKAGSSISKLYFLSFLLNFVLSYISQFENQQPSGRTWSKFTSEQENNGESMRKKRLNPISNSDAVPTCSNLRKSTQNSKKLPLRFD